MKRAARSAVCILSAVCAVVLLTGAAGVALVIPEGTTVIEDSAYKNRILYSSVEIPESVTEIGSYAFYGCTGLTEVTIPDSVTTIGDHAFMGCTGLTNITVPGDPGDLDEIGLHLFIDTALVWGDVSLFCLPGEDTPEGDISKVGSLTGCRIVPLNLYSENRYCLSELYLMLPDPVRTQDCEEADYALARRIRYIPRTDYTGPANDTVTELWLCGKDGRCVLVSSILHEPPSSGRVVWGLSLAGAQADASEIWDDIRGLFK